MILLRRRLLAAGLALPFADALAQSCTRTPSQTEGPFFKTDTPLRASFLEKDSLGRLVVSGQVLSARCQSVPNAFLEFWHVDDAPEAVCAIERKINELVARLGGSGGTC